MNEEEREMERKEGTREKGMVGRRAWKQDKKTWAEEGKDESNAGQ